VVAVDTNVLVRLITQDDAAQAARATRLFKRESVWIAKTVLLETNWVLGSLYGFTAKDIRDSLRSVAGLPNVHLEDPLLAAQALTWMDSGIDLADALHLASRREAAHFASFDSQFVKRASKLDVPTLLL
jgi:predicted nucleic-acid-binding protein